MANEKGNIIRRSPAPRFSDLEVGALSMVAEAEEIDSENWLFESRLNECRHLIPNLISRRQFNDRRKTTSNLCEQIRGRIANHIDGGEGYFCIDSKLVEECRLARGKRCQMGRNGVFSVAPDLGKKKGGDFVLTTQRSNPCYQKLCQRHMRPVYENHQQISALTVLQYVNYTN